MKETRDVLQCMHVHLRKGHRHSHQAQQPLAPVDLEQLLASLCLQALPSPLYQRSPATAIRHEHCQGGERQLCRGSPIKVAINSDATDGVK